MASLGMNDKELAQLAVGFGVGLYLITDQKHSMLPGPEQHFEIDCCSMTDSEFVRDWRVSGACLERMTCIQISSLCRTADGLFYHAWLKDPRAIIEAACSEALA